MQKWMRPGEPSELEAQLASEGAVGIVDEILSATPSGAIIVSAPDRLVVRVTDFTEQLTGFRKSEFEGMPIGDLPEKLQLCDAAGRRLATEELPLARALCGEKVVGFDGWFTQASGELIPFVSNAAPIRDARGEVIGSINSFRDMRPYKALERDLRDAVAQREALYRELAHRVKNHLQIMTSLIRFESRDPDLSAGGLADRMIARIQTLAAVYSGMTHAGAGAAIEARAFVEAICRPYRSGAVAVEVSMQPSDIALSSEQALPLGMLLNEAICNCHKHAFPGRRGHIWVTLARAGLTGLHLEVNDNGVGCEPGEVAQPPQGLALMRMFADELHGAFALAERPGGGVRVTVELPGVFQ
jgi:two-component sensor histidine kinase